MTSLLSYALVTVGDVKNFMGIDTPVYDEPLTMLVNAMTDYIEGRTGRRLKSTVYAGATAELVNGDGTDLLQLKNYPVTAVSLVEENSNADNSSNFSTVDTNEYFSAGPLADAGLLKKTVDYFPGTSNYRVSYTGGYATIPSDLQYACLMLVSEAFNRRRSAGVKSESLGDHSITFESIAMENDNVEKIIQRYRPLTVL